MSGVTTRDLLFCPHCEQWVPHKRGYLNEHHSSIQRGELVTGSKFCDGSNTRPAMNLKSVTFTGLCINCVSPVRKEFTEVFPGSLEQYGGVLTVQCPECSPEGDYCAHCTLDLHKTYWSAPDCMAGGECAGLLGGKIVTCLRCKTDYDVENLPFVSPVAIWQDDEGGVNCPGGQPHSQAHRPERNFPVICTDNHVLIESLDED